MCACICEALGPVQGEGGEESMEGNVIGEGDMGKKQSETRPSGAAVRTEVSTLTSRRCWVLLFPQRPQFFLVAVGVCIVGSVQQLLAF